MTNIQGDMSDISQNALDSVLSALGEQLGAKDAPMHLVVVGGSGLLAMGWATGRLRTSMSSRSFKKVGSSVPRRSPTRSKRRRSAWRTTSG